MEIKTKEIAGILFIKIGDFFLYDKPWKGSNKRHGDWEVWSGIKLIDDRLMKADENCYLLTIDNKVVYVGEYLYNLEKRWFKYGYVNHGTWKEIDLALINNQEVELWLVYDPLIKIDENNEINITKSIEQKIIDELNPKYNRRSRRSKENNKGSIKIKEIITL